VGRPRLGPMPAATAGTSQTKKRQPRQQPAQRRDALQVHAVRVVAQRVAFAHHERSFPDPARQAKPEIRVRARDRDALGEVAAGLGPHGAELVDPRGDRGGEAERDGGDQEDVRRVRGARGGPVRHGGSSRENRHRGVRRASRCSSSDAARLAGLAGGWVEEAGARNVRKRVRSSSPRIRSAPGGSSRVTIAAALARLQAPSRDRAALRETASPPAVFLRSRARQVGCAGGRSSAQSLS
jgi:hypothetical protein